MYHSSGSPAKNEDQDLKRFGGEMTTFDLPPPVDNTHAPVDIYNSLNFFISSQERGYSLTSNNCVDAVINFLRQYNYLLPDEKKILPTRPIQVAKQIGLFLMDHEKESRQKCLAEAKEEKDETKRFYLVKQLITHELKYLEIEIRLLNIKGEEKLMKERLDDFASLYSLRNILNESPVDQKKCTTAFEKITLKNSETQCKLKEISSVLSPTPSRDFRR